MKVSVMRWAVTPFLETLKVRESVWGCRRIRITATTMNARKTYCLLLNDADQSARVAGIGNGRDNSRCLFVTDMRVPLQLKRISDADGGEVTRNAGCTRARDGIIDVGIWKFEFV